MEKAGILLLKPTGNFPSAVDQSLGACLAAFQGPSRDQIVLEQDSFESGNWENLEKTVRRWAARVSGVVGATNVQDSAKLGELAEQFNLLCFVSNNNPVVWQRRRHIFHIGVPTAATFAALADHLLKNPGVERIYILHDETEFQMRVAETTESFLKAKGGEVRSQPGTRAAWLDDVRSWKPALLYLAYSNESLALPLAQSLRRALPDLLLLLGRSLVRHSFLSSLGEASEGLLLVDIFYRTASRRKKEKMFLEVLDQAGVKIPTANHGFGWDALTLCALALAEGARDVLSAIKFLESGVDLEGATGYYLFNAEDHNGRAMFNPVILSQVRNSQVRTYGETHQCG